MNPFSESTSTPFGLGQDSWASNLGPEAQELLQAGRATLRPTAVDRERVIAALRSFLGDAACAPDATALATIAAPAAAAGILGWRAISAVVAGLAVTGAVAVVAFRSSAPESAPAAVVAAPSSPPAAVATTPESVPTAPEPAPAIELTRPVEPSSTASPQRRSDRLAEEVAILSRAETELHAGRYQGALSVLEEHARQFPRGTLAQERVATRIRALCALGRTAEADAALGLLSPDSLLEGRAREACAAASKK